LHTSSVGATNVGNLLGKIKVITRLLGPHMDKESTWMLFACEDNIGWVWFKKGVSKGLVLA
jgi:hypothetical protein